ncbi:MAG: PepSY domain-containing protein [Candidatus Thiodiazotropha sp.]|jgi:uncharacterized membrane protein YkoI
MRIVIDILLSSLLIMGSVFADDSYLEARRLAAEGKIQPLEMILKQLQSIQPGEILEVEFDHEGHKVIYEIELLDAYGHVQELKVDAVSGEILEQELED